MTETVDTADTAGTGRTPDAAGTAGRAQRPGLRERKKQRTRDALLRAALELFTTQGYERTTVDEITEAVDVSQRTFEGADIALHQSSHIKQYIVRDAGAFVLCLLLQDRQSGLQIGSNDVGNEAALESRTEPLVHRP